jgi:hypothetical protein
MYSAHRISSDRRNRCQELKILPEAIGIVSDWAEIVQGSKMVE